MTAAPTLVTGPTGWASHARVLLGLAVPLVLSNAAGFAIHMTDVVLLGWYDVTALAGMILAGSFYFIVFITGSGFAAAVMPLVAHAVERGDPTEARRVTRMGLWLSMAFAAVAIPCLLAAGPIFEAIGQEPDVAAAAASYLRIAGWMIAPALLIALLRSFLAALERTAVLLWVTLGAGVLNALWGYAMIFGAWGLPELGIRGAAWAALLTNTASALLLGAYVLWKMPEFHLLQRIWRMDGAALSRVFRLGWPIGGQLLAEVGLFAGSAMMVGWVGEVPLAAHGVALQLASLAFMVHLGLSQAATVRTGQAVGRGDPSGLRQGAIVAVALSAGFALLTILVFLVWPAPLLGLFVDPSDPEAAEVIRVGVTLLALAAAFSLFDGAQVIAIGLLRGLQDTTVPMLMAAVSYWVVGLPLAYVLGFVWGGDEVGVWLGLVASLVVASGLLLWRFHRLAWQPAAARPAIP